MKSCLNLAFVELILLSVIASVEIIRLVDSKYIQNSTLSWARCWLIGVVHRGGVRMHSEISSTQIFGRHVGLIRIASIRDFNLEVSRVFLVILWS